MDIRESGGGVLRKEYAVECAFKKANEKRGPGVQLSVKVLALIPCGVRGKQPEVWGRESVHDEYSINFYLFRPSLISVFQ